MQDSSVIQRPNEGSVTLHWLGAALVLLALLAGLFAAYYSSGCCATDRRIAYLLHTYAGLSVLGLVVLRLMFRASYSWPDPAKSGKEGFGNAAAKVIHWTLYGLMILIPLTGWIMASGMGCCWYVPGLPDVNMLSLGIGSTTPADVGTAYQVHVTLAWMIIVLISLHVSAALFNHVFLKNDVLQRMLPVRFPPKDARNDRNGRATPAPIKTEDA